MLKKFDYKIESSSTEMETIRKQSNGYNNTEKYDPI